MDSLRARGSERDAATARLHELLLRAARFECSRRRDSLARVGAAELDDLAHQAADDALVAVLRKLDSFRGDSRFTTWAYKFALLEAGVKLRRRAWEGRELPLDDEARVPDLRPSPEVALVAVLTGAAVVFFGIVPSPLFHLVHDVGTSLSSLL